MKIILDMDPGIDDAVTLLIALGHPKLEVLAVTAVNGNVNVDTATYNALRLVEAANKDVAVARGAAKPLRKRLIHSTHVHGRDGLGNSNLPGPSRKHNSIGAVRMMKNLISTHKRRELTLVATGPLTNVAMLLAKEPSFARKLNKIVLMGGVYGVARGARGNVTPYAEFNFYCDPEAADIVLNSGASIVAAGLDVTMNRRCAVGKDMLKEVCGLGSLPAGIAGMMLQYPVYRYGIFHLHDVFALAALLHPAMFRMVRCGVRVDKRGMYRGRCVTKPDAGSISVCSGVDHKEFREFVLQGLGSG